MMTFDKVTLTTACNWDDEYFDWLNVTRSRVLKKQMIYQKNII